jgi:hypothetical protein
MVTLSFSGRRIKTPERGLLAMHPFVDVLEGRSLFTATAHDGVLDVTAVADAPAGEATEASWSTEYIDGESAAAAADDDGLAGLLAATTPSRIELDAETTGSAFADAGPIGDTGQTLFGNIQWDRRGRAESPPLPTDAQLAAARQTLPAGPTHGSTFHAGRTLTGAMRPYLMMTAAQANHPFVV